MLERSNKLEFLKVSNQFETKIPNIVECPNR